jgi:hypothetical protein
MRGVESSYSEVAIALSCRSGYFKIYSSDFCRTHLSVDWRSKFKIGRNNIGGEGDSLIALSSILFLYSIHFDV